MQPWELFKTLMSVREITELVNWQQEICFIINVAAADYFT